MNRQREPCYYCEARVYKHMHVYVYSNYTTRDALPEAIYALNIFSKVFCMGGRWKNFTSFLISWIANWKMKNFQYKKQYLMPQWEKFSIFVKGSSSGYTASTSSGSNAQRHSFDLFFDSRHSLPIFSANVRGDETLQLRDAYEFSGAGRRI